MKTAEDTFNEFLTTGRGDSDPTVNVEHTEEVKEVVDNKGYRTLQITTGFKLSIPGTYSSVEHSETVEVYPKADIQEVREDLIRHVANHTFQAATHYLATLINKVQ